VLSSESRVAPRGQRPSYDYSASRSDRQGYGRQFNPAPGWRLALRLYKIVLALAPRRSNPKEPTGQTLELLQQFPFSASVKHSIRRELAAIISVWSLTTIESFPPDGVETP